MYQKRIAVWILAVLLLGCFVAPSYASPLTAKSIPLSENEMEEVTGEFLGEVIVGTLIAYTATQVMDYYGVDEWMQETAIPAVESAVVSAYETTVDLITRSFEIVGEALMEYSTAWMW